MTPSRAFGALVLTALVGLFGGTSSSADGGATPGGRAARASDTLPGPVPIVVQAFPNDCEAAALSMLLAAAGRPVDQRVLQRLLPRSGPLDPITASDGVWVWGDPDQGFVGRVAGDGVAGGFGVYQGPIRRLASRYGVRLVDLTRRPLETIVDRLRRRRPVMVWIGLSEGPYRHWRTPDGKLIGVNFGEHTVILTGVRDGRLLVNDPLTGRRLSWSPAELDAKWRLLGRRALGI